jgi:phage terminase large subunit GpA-like protein
MPETDPRFPDALAVVAAALAAIFAPPVPIAPSRWAAENLIVPDGEYAGAKFDLALTPHLAEPLDMLGPDSAVNEIDVEKSAQTGFTLLLLAAIGHSIDRDPCDMIVVQPIDSALADFNSQKLGRTIEKTPILAKKVRSQTARSGQASTTYEKKFGGNSLFLAIATSSADLSSKTIKKAFLDEIDRYPDDVDGQGSPYSLVVKRQTMFLMSGTWKRACISTPTVKGASAITERFESGDQRYWHVRCPHCAPKDAKPTGERKDYEFTFEYGPNFKFATVYPHAAHYVTPCCGCIIEGWQKNEVYRTGRWIALAPGAGRHPSYHFDALSSPFVPWDTIAAEAVAAGDDPAKLKPFYNLTLGRAYEVKGDAPDHLVLMQRREDYKRGHIPPGALLVTIAADVQMRGIYYEVVAWTPDRRSYVIEADYLDGATTDHDDGAFAALSDVYHRTWPDAFGRRHQADEFGVDSGYRTQVVYTWVRSPSRHQGAQGRRWLGRAGARRRQRSGCRLSRQALQGRR